MKAELFGSAESEGVQPPRFRRYAKALLRALWGAVIGRASAVQADRAQPVTLSMPERRILTAVAVSIAAALFAAVLIQYFGGFEFHLGAATLRATSGRGPIRLALALAFSRLLLADALGGWHLERSLLALSRARLASRISALAGACVVIGCLGHAVAAVTEAGGWIIHGVSVPSVRADSSHRHLKPLVEAIVGRGDGGPFVVAIDDVNPRGHMAAYYCYPRVLLMSPARSYWSMTKRMTDGWKLDPSHAGTGATPRIDEDAAFARARGMPFLVASEEGAVERAAEPVSPRSGER